MDYIGFAARWCTVEIRKANTNVPKDALDLLEKLLKKEIKQRMEACKSLVIDFMKDTRMIFSLAKKAGIDNLKLSLTSVIYISEGKVKLKLKNSDPITIFNK